MVLVMDGAGGWMGCGGAPPRRPGRGGGRSWRRRGERERDVPGPKGIESALGILMVEIIILTLSANFVTK